MSKTYFIPPPDTYKIIDAGPICTNMALPIATSGATTKVGQSILMQPKPLTSTHYMADGTPIPFQPATKPAATEKPSIPEYGELSCPGRKVVKGGKPCR